MTERYPRMVPLGYGIYARADRIFAVVPLLAGQRGDRRRTLVHVEGLDEPLIASRSERAILADMVAARAELEPPPPRRRRTRPHDEPGLF